RINRIVYFNTTVLNPISSAIGFPVHGGFEYAGVNGNDRYAWPPNDKDFAPRAGIAFKITDRLVARMGAGIFFLPPSAMITFDHQYQLSPHSVFQIGYAGNRGRKLLYGNPNIDADQLPGQFLALQSQLDRQVANPFFGVLDPSTPLGSQNTIAFNQLLRPYP